MSEHNGLNQVDKLQEEKNELTNSIYALEACISDELTTHMETQLNIEADVTVKNLKIIEPEIKVIQDKELKLAASRESLAVEEQTLANIKQELQKIEIKQLEISAIEDKRQAVVDNRHTLECMETELEQIDIEQIDIERELNEKNELLKFVQNPTAMNGGLVGEYTVDAFMLEQKLFKGQKYADLTKNQRKTVRVSIQKAINTSRGEKEAVQNKKNQLSIEIDKKHNTIRELEEEIRRMQDQLPQLKQGEKAKNKEIEEAERKIGYIKKRIQQIEQSKVKKEELKVKKLKTYLRTYFKNYCKLNVDEKKQKWQHNAEVCNKIADELNGLEIPEEANDLSVKDCIDNIIKKFQLSEIIEDISNYLKCNQHYQKCIEEKVLNGMQELIPEDKDHYGLETINALSEFGNKFTEDRISFAQYKNANRNADPDQNIIDAKNALSAFQEKQKVYDSTLQLDKRSIDANLVVPLRALAESLNKVVEYEEKSLEDDAYNHLVFVHDVTKPNSEEMISEYDIKLTTLGKAVNIAGIKAKVLKEALSKQQPNEMEVSNLQLNQNLELAEDPEPVDVIDEQQQPQNRLNGGIEANLENEHKEPKSLINEKNHADYEEYKRKQERGLKRSFSF